MLDAAPAEAVTARIASLGAVRPAAATGKLVAVNAAAGALFALYLWQIFYTMPHLAVLSGDSGSYLQLFPHRTVGFYYFSRAIFAWWNDYYAVAAAQGVLLGAASLFLFYALNRTTGWSLLALGTLLLCLFRGSSIADTQSVASDPLFATACLALLAAAILLWQRPSPTHIGLFVLFGFAASIIRPVGPAVVWPLVLVLALRLWREWRRALAILVAGCVGSQVMNAAIHYVHFGILAPAHLGFVLIGGTAFITDENAPADIPYAREFAQSTAAQRAEYEAAATWGQKFEVMDRQYNPVTWGIAPALFARSGEFHGWDWITANRRLQDISFAAIRYNPLGYGRMTLIKLVAGISMFFGNDHAELQSGFTHGVATQRIDLGQAYLDQLLLEPRWTRSDYDDEKARLAAYIRDWQASPLDLRHDIARPPRDLIGLLAIDAVCRLFVFETGVLMVVAIGMAWRNRHVGDCLTFLLLFVVPPWIYLLAVSLTHIPLPRYMDATSLFVILALPAGAWVLGARLFEKATQPRSGR